ncbi:hypothetical protein C7S18_23630 (plasmid) [Ahniella affigens]|uniref:Uncharacterized protein n=2 Tax=Ahniella affigens TaxID=2021234 RepID=A0A2P1PZM3_9GAMM|nr:conjugative transfer protein MobI(A/C) [Ahniella affigens]AVQ00291.1 hypothetical protein C7S18_23630 [Ahniella affigens]
MGKTRAELNTPSDLATAITRCAGHVAALVSKELDALVRTARTLQEQYESRRTAEETRWQHMVLAIKTGPSLVLQWSRRRRIRRTATGRAWWWDTMPYDAKRRCCPIRALTANQPPEIAALIISTESAATEIRKNWQLVTRLRITATALMRLGQLAPAESPWLHLTGKNGSTILAQDHMQDPDSFATTVLMFVAALQDQLLRNGDALSQYVENNRSNKGYRLRSNRRGNSLDLAWYHGPAASRTTVTRRKNANITRLIATNSEDANLIRECEAAATVIRRAWAMCGQLIARAKEIEKLTKACAPRKLGEIAMGGLGGNPEAPPRSSK